MDLRPSQVSCLETLLTAGFRLVTLEHVERYLPVEKNGFVALLDPSEGKLRIFGQPGYRVAGGIGMLVESGEGKAFVWKKEFVRAGPELLAAYDRFRAELRALLTRKAP